MLTALSIGFPVVFLSVAAFMTNAVLSRLLTLQREQIAILKAFGFTNRQIVVHYLKFAFVMVAGGTVLGSLGGIGLGHRLVHLYTAFFRFPDLHFSSTRRRFRSRWSSAPGAALAGVFSAVRRAARLPPAEAMRPEPPANYRPALVERTGIAHWLSHTFRIAVRNLERRPMQAVFTVAGLSLATGILIVPNGFRDSVSYVLDYPMGHDPTTGLEHRPRRAGARGGQPPLPQTAGRGDDGAVPHRLRAHPQRPAPAPTRPCRARCRMRSTTA